jgi:hypothetical protein
MLVTVELSAQDFYHRAIGFVLAFAREKPGNIVSCAILAEEHRILFLLPEGVHALSDAQERMLTQGQTHHTLIYSIETAQEEKHV